MANLFGFIAQPLGLFLRFLYDTIAFRNWGVSIIFFTIFIKLLLLPLTIKQLKSTAKMQEVQPKIAEAQKRYKNDKEKLNQEMMRIYSENDVNPAGGCLPLLVQMPILFSLYWVISQPLKYMFQKSAETIQALYNLIPQEITSTMRAFSYDIPILNYFNEHPEELIKAEGLLAPNEVLNLNFLGIFNLGMTPTFDYSTITADLRYLPLLLVPILAAVTTWISTKVTMPQSDKNSQANQTQNSMTKIMPFITAFFAFSVPAGLGLYWIISNAVQVGQQLYLNKYIINKKEVDSK